MYCKVLLFEEKADDVVEVGVYHQSEEEHHADDLNTLQEFVTGLATSNHLNQEEEQVTSIEGGNGKYVHESEHDRNERSHHPEAIPIPLRGEEATDSYEAANLCGALLGEYVFKVTDVAL